MSPYNSDNNVNGVHGDVGSIAGEGDDLQHYPLPAVEAIERARIRAIVRSGRRSRQCTL
ncbi:MAG: hypothetical protein R3C68_12665 [Myxococcota bacterium]